MTTFPAGDKEQAQNETHKRKEELFGFQRKAKEVFVNTS